MLLDEARLSRMVLETAARVIATSRAMWAGELIVLEPRSSGHEPAVRGVGQVPAAWREVRRPMRGRLRHAGTKRRYAEAA